MQFDLSGVSVHIGMPVHGNVPPQTILAVVSVVSELKDRGIPHYLELTCDCSIIQQARCLMAHSFLTGEHTHLFQIDADMDFTAAQFMRVLALGIKKEVVAGSYPLKREPLTWMLGADGVAEIDEYGCMNVGGLGLGFCCVQRKVMQRLAAEAPLVSFAERPERVPMIFRADVDKGSFRGEDMAFFADVRALGYKVWLDPTVDVGHIGRKIFKGNILEALKKV